MNEETKRSIEKEAKQLIASGELTNKKEASMYFSFKYSEQESKCAGFIQRLINNGKLDFTNE